jgi:uncharacterized membrane protein YjgN (DUF898 family)
MEQLPNNYQANLANGNAAQPAAPSDYHAHPFQFTGSASEYFRIWVVNTLLSIVTLGIYSAWAKVRTKQYFYRNTQVDGHSFDYLGDPIAILKGRIIVAVFLGLVGWSQRYEPRAFPFVALVLLLVTPWVTVKSLAFNARNSTYRNIRFAFPGRVGESYGVYLKTALIYVVSCGLAYPWAQWTLTRFIAYRHYYGDLPFSFRPKCGDYYRVYLVALALAIPGYCAMFGATVAMPYLPPSIAPIVMGVVMVSFFLYLLIPVAYARAELGNLLYGGLMVHAHGFTSTQRFQSLLKLYVVNALAIVCSVGLLIPWAKIRLAKYRADTLTLHICGSLHAETLLDDNTNALGEGMTDLGDFDLGIGV